MTDAKHLILVSPTSVTAVRERIERRLGVETYASPWSEPQADHPKWAIHFTAPHDVDLDFLRPDVLPPKEGS